MLIATALLVTALWGFNFVVIEVAVRDVPPLLLVALRFGFAAFPALLLVKKPATSWRNLALYGLLLGVGEFGFLFTAIKLGAPAGLSSVILQSQAFLTALLAVVFLGEKFRSHHAVGLLLAGVGLGLMGVLRAGNGAVTMPWLGLLFLLLAALGWAAANVVARKIGPVDALGLMVWSSVFSPLPLLALSWAFEGPQAIGYALTHMGLLSWSALAYLTLLSTLLGYGLWNSLIARRGASAVAPFSLLVPVFGLSSAWLVLGQTLTWEHALAALLILAGLVIHVFGGKWRRKP
jgi:O-acetylserine/cysteine efflux transporter